MLTIRHKFRWTITYHVFLTIASVGLAVGVNRYLDSLPDSRVEEGRNENTARQESPATRPSIGLREGGNSFGADYRERGINQYL